MNIALFIDALLPARNYGGTERVVWSLGKGLKRLGHNVTLIAAKGSAADFARVIPIDPKVSVSSLIPEDTDIIHFQNALPAGLSPESCPVPYVITVHGNSQGFPVVDPWSVFVSRNHAERYGASAFVYNCLEWDDYPQFLPDMERKNLFFLGKAAWRVKNLKGAIKVANKAGMRLDVLGGYRVNFKMGFRITFDLSVRFHGMVDNLRKAEIANRSRGLIFPVVWHEPFGLAVVEALYFGAPVFATPYGSLPELVTPDVGVLSESADVLADAAQHFIADNKLCHEYARDRFNSDVMARRYLRYYEDRLNGVLINPSLHTPPLSPSDYSVCQFSTDSK